MFVTEKKIIALTQGNNVPSRRFRWAQHQNILVDSGFAVTEVSSLAGGYAPAFKPVRPLWLTAALIDAFFRSIRTFRHDLVFLQRNLIATLCTWEPLLKKPLVFDVDDAIFLGTRGASANRIAQSATLTICGNSFLAEHFSQYSKVKIVPTAVDAKRFAPGVCIQKTARPVIGWSGSSSGFKYLELIQPALRHILAKYPDVIFKVISDRRPVLPQLPASQIHFVQWTQECEVSELQDLTVGIMPLLDTPWERGKCSYKMLTYMSVGVPVVVSPVGMNNEVLGFGHCGLAAISIDDWIDAVSFLLTHSSQARTMGERGRGIVLENYSKDIISSRLIDIFLSVSP